MTPAEFRQVRKDLNLTQAQLAEKLGVHPITISHYETGARKIALATAIAVQTFRPESREPTEVTLQTVHTSGIP